MHGWKFVRLDQTQFCVLWIWSCILLFFRSQQTCRRMGGSKHQFFENYTYCPKLYLGTIIPEDLVRYAVHDRCGSIAFKSRDPSCGVIYCRKYGPCRHFYQQGFFSARISSAWGLSFIRLRTGTSLVMRHPNSTCVFSFL